MKSIRLYLVIVLLSTICLVNFLAAMHGYRGSMAAGDKLLDKQLIEMTQSLARLNAIQAQLPPNMFAERSVYQIFSQGKLVQHSNNAPAEFKVPLQAGFHMVGWNSVLWRVYVYHDPTTNGWVSLGLQYDLNRSLIERMVMESILPIIWVLPILGLLIWLIVSYGIKPLSDLASSLKRREINELRPIQQESYPKEFNVVIESINTLFQHLGSAFDREQRFAADAAHELRTPLASLKINLYNILEEQGSTDSDRSSSLSELKASVDRMGHSIEQILALYRLTPEKFNLTTAPCDLHASLQSIIIGMYDNVLTKHQNIELFGDKNIINGDEFALSVMLRNLLDNASKYTPDGGKILITLTHEKENALIKIEDSGSGIKEQNYKRVFDRFYRIGGDRHQSKIIGSGLGLSIVNHIVDLHHGKIKLDHSEKLGGLSVCISLPKIQNDTKVHLRTRS